MKEKAESLQQPKTWNYEQYKAYLLLLSRKPEAILDYNQFPKTIQLSKDWHSFLNQTRSETKDDHERYAIAGCKPDFYALYLSSKATKGNPHEVPAKILSNEEEKAINNNIEIIEIIHSHSTPYGFSSKDLYFLLTFVQPVKVMCLVNHNNNFLAFPSKETEQTRDPKILSQDKFAEFWKKQASNTHDAAIKIAQRHKLVFYSGEPNKDLKRITT
jgi:hypothetical protein